MKAIHAFSSLLLAAAFLTSCTQTQAPSRIGVYPGDPDEYDGPVMTAADGSYRNLALHRPAWHSGSMDYNLTGHLVTDGIVTSEAPVFMQLLAGGENIETRLRERLFDDNFTAVTVPGKAGARLELGLEMI
ncbi:MAG: hypothetical protein IKX11_01480 [Bacteroidales bacterium]|nr:hypothetical protein [Bacteroidales bacterium]